jgi:hypothetical protein
VFSPYLPLYLRRYFFAFFAAYFCAVSFPCFRPFLFALAGVCRAACIDLLLVPASGGDVIGKFLAGDFSGCHSLRERNDGVALLKKDRVEPLPATQNQSQDEAEVFAVNLCLAGKRPRINRPAAHRGGA